MSEKETREENLIRIFLSNADDWQSVYLENLMNAAKDSRRFNFKLPPTSRHITAAMEYGQIISPVPLRKSDDIDIFVCAPREPTASIENLSRLLATPAKDLNIDDVIRDAVGKAIEVIEELNARNTINNCMTEIEETRKRMQKDQDDIEQLTADARTILTTLQTS